ncbi:MAG: alpha/beta hydrolase [Endomicrobium sp.]|jgi:pimeloyl-ACP methyl ester carboxylesterase|nr:alpha/beta hydrolase [Endomicrobium sp.]
MKAIIFILISACFLVLNVFAADLPDISGKWYGQLKEHGVYLKIALNIKKNENVYHASLDSLLQNTYNIAVSTFSFDNQAVNFTITDLVIEYKGTLEKNGNIKGIFRQHGQDFNVTFSKTQIGRPQEPAKPYPYIEEKIVFEDKKSGIKIDGTLTLPHAKGSFPAVILISGNGPQNRDGEIFGHKPFLVIADYLTNNGIAVLRYDDIGTAYSSGHFASATIADFAAAAESALAYLKNRKEINKKNIGFIAHSEGAASASIIAAQNEDVAFMVFLSACGLPGKDIIVKQYELIGKASKIEKKYFKRDLQINKKATEIVSTAPDIGQLRSLLFNYLGKTFDGFSPSVIPRGIGKADFMRTYTNIYTTPSMIYFLKYNPTDSLKRVKCPVFAVWGGKDLQVSAKENLKAVKKALKAGDNKDVTLKIFPNLNHLFQECKSGLPEEYSQIEQTFSPEVLSEITDWITLRTAN